MTEGAITITLKDVYDAQREQEKQLGEISSTLKLQAITMQRLVDTDSRLERVAELAQTMYAQGAGAEHERRIQSLERSRAAIPVSLVVSIGSIATAVFAALHH